MIGNAIVNAALQEDLSLEYAGKPVATLHKAGFADPNYRSQCEFIDPKVAEQMLKARHFDRWVHSRHQAHKEPTNVELTAEMARLGLEAEYYQMRHGHLWVVKDDKGVVTAIDVIDMDNNAIEWRLGKVIFRPKKLLPHWLSTTLNVIYFILFLVGLGIIHNLFFS